MSTALHLDETAFTGYSSDEIAFTDQNNIQIFIPQT